MLIANVNWNQVIATAASAVVVIAFLSAVMYRLVRTVIEKTIPEIVEPAIAKVTEQQAEALRGIVDAIAELRAQMVSNTSDIAFLKGVHEGEKQEARRTPTRRRVTGDS